MMKSRKEKREGIRGIWAQHRFFDFALSNLFKENFNKHIISSKGFQETTKRKIKKKRRRFKKRE